MRDEMAVPGWPHSREGWSEVFPELAGLDDDPLDDFGSEDWTGGDEAGGTGLRIEDATRDYSVLAAVMRNERTAVVGQDEEWFVASCPDVPGANGQGGTREECLANLAEAIELIMDG